MIKDRVGFHKQDIGIGY